MPPSTTCTPIPSLVMQFLLKERQEGVAERRQATRKAAAIFYPLSMSLYRGACSQRLQEFKTGEKKKKKAFCSGFTLENIRQILFFFFFFGAWKMCQDLVSKL